MRTIIALGLASVVTLVAASPALAAQGCGPGMHRAPNGTCVVNRGGRQVVYVENRYYPHHGYWHQNRWWHRRYRHNNQWMYR